MQREGENKMADNKKTEIEEIEKKRKTDVIPSVFYLLFVAGAFFLVVYVVRFTPVFSGYSSVNDYLGTAQEPGINTDKLKQENPLGNDPSAVSEGQAVYADYCVDCHGENAKGDFGPDSTDSEWKYGASDEEKFDVIINGRNANTDNEMPSFKEDLKEEQIWKVIAYIDSLK